MKIFLDLDGVFADLDDKIEEVMAGLVWKRMSNDIWPHLEKVPNLFSTLNLMPGSLQIVTMLMHHDLEILSAVPEPTGFLTTAREDKTAWVAKHINPVIKVNLAQGGKNKVNWLKEHPGAVLIDDYDRNINQWTAAGGIGILHTSVEETIKDLKWLKLI